MHGGKWFDKLGCSLFFTDSFVANNAILIDFWPFLAVVPWWTSLKVTSFRDEYVKKRNESAADQPAARYLKEREEARRKAEEAAKRPTPSMSSTGKRPAMVDESRLWNNKKPKNNYVGGSGDPARVFILFCFVNFIE